MGAVSRKSSWFAFAFVVALVIWQAFIPPEIGSADNADFPKLTGPFSLGNPAGEPHHVQYADLHYAFGPQYHWDSRFYSSELLMLYAALGINRIASPAGSFDMRVMGAMNAAVFLWTFYLLLPVAEALPRWPRRLLLAGSAAMFTDVMYVAYFNSFFMDTASLLFLLLAVVAYARAMLWKRPLDWWLCVAASALLVLSKTQHLLLGVPLAVLFWWTGPHLMPRGRTWGAAAAILMLVATGLSTQMVSFGYPTLARYNVIFGKILPGTKNMDAALTDLGLDSSYAKYSGTSAFVPGAGVQDPAFAREFERRSSYLQFILFSVKHPDDALRCIVDRLSEAGRQRAERGNYDVGAGKPPGTESVAVAYWSGLKARLFHNHGRRYLLWALLLVAAAFALAFRFGGSGPATAGLMTLAAMLVLDLLVSGLGDALDAIRHFLVFDALADILLLTLAVAALLALSGLNHDRKGAGNSSSRPQLPV